MCLNLQINVLEVELGAKVVADLMSLMNDVGNSNATNSSLVTDCMLLISQLSQVKVTHCHRKANRYANALAKLVTHQISNVLYNNSPPLICFPFGFVWPLSFLALP